MKPQLLLILGGPTLLPIGAATSVREAALDEFLVLELGVALERRRPSHLPRGRMESR